MSTAKLIFVVMLLTTIEVASFGLINMPARSGIETNPGPTNSNTLEWFEKIQKEGKVSEEKLKAEAQIFFKTDFKEDKKLVKTVRSHAIPSTPIRCFRMPLGDDLLGGAGLGSPRERQSREC